MLDKTVREPVPGGVGWEKGQLNDIESMILTSAKNNHIAPDNRTLTVAKTKKKSQKGAPKRTKTFRHERRKSKNQAGRLSYIPMARILPMPPRIMTPPTARLTSRLCNRAFLRSAFKAQKPLRSRAKKYSRAWESHTRKSKEKENLSFKLSGRYGVGGERAAINIQDIRIVHRGFCPPCRF